MARSRSVARIASRVPAPRVVDPFRRVRNFVQTSPWLAIAIAAHVIVGAAFAVVSLAHGGGPAIERGDLILTPIGRARPDPEPFIEPEEDIISRNTIPENEVVELVPPNTPVVPLLENVEIDYRLDIGDPNAEPDSGSELPDGLPGLTGGTAIGVGPEGHVGGGVSTASTSRLGTNGIPGGRGPKTPGGRPPGGPTVVIDEAILNGMLWLARHQDASGRWSGATCAQICEAVDPTKPCQPETALEAGLYSTQADVGMTSLALLAFLGAGFTSSSRAIIVDKLAGRPITIGRDVVLPGLKWLASQQRPDGSFSDAGGYFLYNEALATLALCEAYGLSRNVYWKKRAQAAVDFICRAQKPNPADASKRWGWRYQPAQPGAGGSELSEADLSVTGWMVMALESARQAGLVVPQASVDGALDFVRWSTGEGGLVGYLGPDTAGDAIVGEHGEFAYHVGTMSAIGMCVRIFLERNLNDPVLHQGADVLARDLPAIGKDPEAPQVDYYYWYYGSLALNQIDGPDAPRATSQYWGPWNKAMNDTILAMQDHTKGACSYGGWMQPDRWSFGFGPVYTTAINVLTLEVYYRYENAFGTKKAPRKDAPRPEPAATLVTDPAPDAGKR